MPNRFVIEDDVLAPKGKIVVEYRGPNPFAFYPRISGLLQTLFQARGVHYFEDDFRWDISSDPRQFLLRMHLDRPLDKFTHGLVHLKIIGEQPSDPKKTGAMFVEISGAINTGFPAETPFQKLVVLPFLWLYNIMLYNKIRRQYLRFYKAGLEKLEAELRNMFGITMRERFT